MSDNTGPDDSGPDSGDTPLSEKEERKVALECLVAGWDEAMRRGVNPQTVAITALSTGLTGLVDCLGPEGARMVAEKLPGQISAGYFSPKGQQQH